MKAKITAMTFLIVIAGCAGGAKRLDHSADMVSDSGGLTRQELEGAASNFAVKIGGYFRANEHPEGVFVAHMPTKNETSEMIPTEFFDNRFVSELIREKIYTVRANSREQSIKEIAFSQSGMTSNMLSIGNMKSPNYFVKCSIEENMFLVKGQRIMEQTVNVELVSVETNIAVWTDRVVYRKQARKGNKGVTW